MYVYVPNLHTVWCFVKNSESKKYSVKTCTLCYSTKSVSCKIDTYDGKYRVNLTLAVHSVVKRDIFSLTEKKKSSNHLFSNFFNGAAQ